MKWWADLDHDWLLIVRMGAGKFAKSPLVPHACRPHNSKLIPDFCWAAISGDTYNCDDPSRWLGPAYGRID